MPSFSVTQTRVRARVTLLQPRAWKSSCDISTCEKEAKEQRSRMCDSGSPEFLDAVDWIKVKEGVLKVKEINLERREAGMEEK